MASFKALPSSGTLNFNFVSDKFNCPSNQDAMYSARTALGSDPGVESTFPNDWYNAVYLGILGDENRSVSNAAGFIDFSIIVKKSWTLSDNAAWMTLDKSSGSGGNTVFRASWPSNNGSQRVGTITLQAGGESVSVTVTQAAFVQTLYISPTSVSASGRGGSFILNIFSNGVWQVSDNAGWVATNGTPGAGNDSQLITYSANNTGSTRNATVSVTGGGLTRNCVITQPPSGINP